MKNFQMKLLPQYFDYIKYGAKRFELRLNDEKRKELNIGDLILFEKLDENKEFLNTRVKNIYKYDNFEQLLNNFDVELIADKSVSKKELLETLNNIYSLTEQKELGVLAIEIEII